MNTKSSYRQASIMAIGLLFVFIYIILLTLSDNGFPISDTLIYSPAFIGVGIIWTGFLVK